MMRIHRSRQNQKPPSSRSTSTSLFVSFCVHFAVNSTYLCTVQQFQCAASVWQRAALVAVSDPAAIANVTWYVAHARARRYDPNHGPTWHSLRLCGTATAAQQRCVASLSSSLSASSSSSSSSSSSYHHHHHHHHHHHQNSLDPQCILTTPKCIVTTPHCRHAVDVCSKPHAAEWVEWHGTTAPQPASRLRHGPWTVSRGIHPVARHAPQPELCLLSTAAAGGIRRDGIPQLRQQQPLQSDELSFQPHWKLKVCSNVTICLCSLPMFHPVSLPLHTVPRCGPRCPTAPTAPPFRCPRQVAWAYSAQLQKMHTNSLSLPCHLPAPRNVRVIIGFCDVNVL